MLQRFYRQPGTGPIPKGISPLPNALVFKLTVTDNAGGTVSDAVTITVSR